MPTPTKGPRLGGSPSHERIILANLASQLFEHGKITTTEAKAKRLRPIAEKLITKAKRGDLHARRTVMATIRDKSVVHVLFTEIAPTFTERDGGYLRITKVGPRKGDNAPMAQIELVTESVADSRKANSAPAPAKKAAPAKKSAAKTAAAPTTAPAVPAPAAEVPAAEVPAAEADVTEVAAPAAESPAPDSVSEAADDEAPTSAADVDEASTDEASADGASTDAASTDDAGEADKA